MERIKVSVIVPIFNMEQWLGQAIDSVVMQTLRDIEIICINDKSTDNSINILQSFSAKDNRIKVINNVENCGVAKCRNDGISCAKGEYVCFLDPDDYYPDREVLQILYEKATKHNAIICGGCFSHVMPDGRIDFGEAFNNEHFFGYNFEKEGFIQYKDYQFDFGYHRFIYRRDFLKTNDISFPELLRFQDPPFMVNAFIKAEKFYAIPMVTYRYRYGHKELKWTSKKINDFLTGAGCNLEIAKENGYETLFELTLKRIFIEQRQPLLENIIDDEGVLSNLGNILFPAGKAYGNGVRYYREFAEELRKKYTDIQIDNDRLHDEVTAVREQLELVSGERQKVKNSISYKTGLFITFIPRKLIHILHGDLK